MRRRCGLLFCFEERLAMTLVQMGTTLPISESRLSNLVVPAGAPDEAAFEITATPTPLQARAFALLGLSPAGT
jgi:hypothetical protein